MQDYSIQMANFQQPKVPVIQRATNKSKVTRIKEIIKLSRNK